MKTYLFKVAKINSQITANNQYKSINKIAIDFTPIPATPSPDVFRAVKINSYLLDVKTDNIEIIRFLANSLIQAEKSLFKSDTFLYVIVYECELGKTINSETNMILMLDVSINKPNHNRDDFVGSKLLAYKASEVKTDTYYRGKSGSDVRHTMRGSGRYEAVFVKDAPRLFVQRCNMTPWVRVQEADKNDDFIGLSVAFEKELGAAEKHIYMGAASKTNYYVNEVGNIVFHRRGEIYKGGFDNYKKVFSAIWPLMSARTFDKDGVLIEAKRVTANGTPNLITEFRAQRRAAYTKGGNSEKMKARLIVMLSEMVNEFCLFINDVQRWGHNLNYSVTGFERTKGLYLRAERLVRLTSAYFPRELTLSSLNLSPQSETNEITEAETLVLGNRFQEVADIFDRLVLMCDWLRRNYVDYRTSAPIPNYFKERQEAAPTYRKEFRGVTNANFSDGNFERIDYTNDEATQRTVGRHPFYPQYTYEVTSITGWARTYWGFGGGQNGSYYTTEGNLYETVEATPKVIGYTVDKPYSDYNQWLEETSQIAADIEIVYMNFQFNALAFIEMFSHLLTILDSKPRAKVTRVKGKLPGQIPVSDEQIKNAKRTYPRSIPRARDTRSEGAIKNIEVPTVPFPDFKPLQIDARAIVKRCAKDFTQQDEDEQRELEIEREANRSAEDRAEFQEQQDEIERRKQRATRKPRFKWRNEIDDLTPEQRYNERVSLYNEIADNLDTVIDIADVVNDALSTFALFAAPPASPLIVGEKVAFKTGKALSKKTIRKLVDIGADIDFPDLPEWDTIEEEAEIDSPEYSTPSPTGEVPRPRVRHKYKPPKRDDTPEFTGDEPEPREWEECVPHIDCYPQYELVIRPARGNGVDKQVVESYEPGGSRTLVQKGLKFFDDVASAALCCEDIPEDDPQSRYRCYRATPRVPRA